MGDSDMQLRNVGCWLLAAFMLFAGIGHFRSTNTFLAQVPPFLPWQVLIVQVAGNLSRFFTQTSAFGLDSNMARGIRLLFQPVLIAWALWCTGAYRKVKGPQ